MPTPPLATGAPAVCIVRDPRLRQTLRRALSAVGSAVEFRDSLDDGTTRARPRVLFIDAESRKLASTASLMAVAGEGGRIVMLGESLEDDDLLALVRDQGLDHLIGDSDQPDESELVTTSVKLLTGNIFGLDKYLSWGASVCEQAITTFPDKRAGIDAVAACARAAGARRQLVVKIASATDELLMNALYDAPDASGGEPKSRRRLGRGTTEAGLVDAPLDPSGASAMLRYGCDGRYFAVSVLDSYGALHKRALLDSLLRARSEGGRPRHGAGGAGLGMYFVLSSATRFIANIERGKQTEIICMFDLRRQGRDTEAYARSLHIFTADRE